jgi:type II secretory pathway pseudopilin PulG
MNLKFKIKNKEINKGFTLIEAVVAIGISGLIIIGVGNLLISGFKYRAVILEQLKTQTEGRKIVQDFVNEIRRANYSSLGAYPISLANDQEIIFYANIDTDSWREKVRYFLDDDILKKGITKPSGNPLTYNPATEVITDIVHDVASGDDPIFFYYGQNYDGSGDYLVSPVSASAVRMVKFDLLLEADPNMSPKPLQIEGAGEIRNLKSN